VDVRTVDNYLLEVDNRLVVPTDTKIRFLLTSGDVIHSWWVPELGWKRDAVPGMVNEAWTLIEEEGIYRGQCAELCGKDHGFMPIVVEAVSPEEYRQWVADQRPERTADGEETAEQAPQVAASSELPEATGDQG
jgi:cytochrome c oxidase subunit 2